MTPILSTDRLLLRPWCELDVTPLRRILLNEEVLRYFPPGPAVTRPRVAALVARQLMHWARYGYGWWAVEEQEREGILCGWCGLQYLPETGETEVAYLFDKPCWGKGLATEGASAALRFGFEQTDLEFIIGLIHPENVASGRVLEKSGLEFSSKKSYFGMTCCRYEINRPGV
jgi:ribosomal-protein-alanine N-acetyltransferase